MLGPVTWENKILRCSNMSSKVFKTLKISVKIFLLLNFLHVFNTKLNVARPRNDIAYDKLFKNENIKSDSKTSKLKTPTECLNDYITLKQVENLSIKRAPINKKKLSKLKTCLFPKFNFFSCEPIRVCQFSRFELGGTNKLIILFGLPPSLVGQLKAYQLFSLLEC